MITRRNFLRSSASAGIATVTTPLWMHLTATRAFAQLSDGYKAIVVITLPGGNDGNNTVIPLDNGLYSQYASLRPSLAMQQGACHQLTATTGAPTYGLHPALSNVAALYNQGQAAIVANVGPLKQPATKAQLLANADLIPPSLLSHPVGVAQWESASTSAAPETGWGGRMADLLKSYSGSLPPVLDAGPASIFTVGQTVQAVAVQASTGALAAIPGELESVILAIANADATSKNQITSAAAKIRIAAAQQGVILNQAQNAGGAITTGFPNSGFGNALKAIAQVIHGRSVIGASRQIFYCMQGSYDSHVNQLVLQQNNLADLDAGLGAFMQAMVEIGVQNQVLVCTHSDFSRSMQANSTGGTDHAWGNHQLVLGGGIQGGKVYGSMPDFNLGGSSDLSNQGIWIPTTSVTQMTAGVGSWMGLNSSQLATVFPDLANFSAGGLTYV